MQALEGDIDTVHFAFLHMGHLSLEDTYEGNFLHYQVKDRAPRYAVTDTEFGTCYGAYRPAAEDTYYWRFANFLFPCYTQIPPGTLAVNRGCRAWVPMDDEHTMFFGIAAPPAGGVTVFPERSKRQDVEARRVNNQRYYFSAQQPDEVILIRVHDSANDGRARLSFHTSFDNPLAPADAPPRESIEVRALVFFRPTPDCGAASLHQARRPRRLPLVPLDAPAAAWMRSQSIVLPVGAGTQNVAHAWVTAYAGITI